MSLSPLEIVHLYHQRTKHRFDGYARGPETLDWDAQPAAFRHFSGAPQVALPTLAELDEALQQRLASPFGASVSASPVEVSLAALAALLQLALGVTAWKSFGGNRWAVRANPSSGNLHPLEAYVVVTGLRELADGVYHYRPDNHALELRTEFAPTDLAAPPSLQIGLTSIIWREAWKYGERAFRYGQLDSGHALAALSYAAELLGWSLAEQRQPGAAAIASLLGVDRDEDFPASRYDNGREEVELLLALGPLPEPAAGATVLARSATARWHGLASPIDARPLYRWPLLDDVAQASRRAGTTGAPLAAAPMPALPPLPAPLGSPSASAVILGRRSAQRFDGTASMALADFVAILDAALPRPQAPWSALPDAGRTAHIALVLFVHRVAGLSPGLYLLPRSPALADSLPGRLATRFAMRPVAGVPAHLGLCLLENGDALPLRRLARALHCQQDIAANACFALGMLAEFAPRLASDPAAYRDLHREAGVIGQALYLHATAQGYAGTGIGCFFDDPVHELLGLSDDTFQTVYHFTVGRAVPDPRIDTSLPALLAGQRAEQASVTPVESANSVAPGNGGVRCISGEAAAALLAGQPSLRIFDVRSLASYQQGHLAGAEHLDGDNIATLIRRLGKQTPLLLYCERGNASQTYGQMLVDFRFSEVYSVDGGYSALLAALPSGAD